MKKLVPWVELQSAQGTFSQGRKKREEWYNDFGLLTEYGGNIIMDYSTLRKTYTSELTNFYQGGAFPKNVSADLRYGLDCQRKRVAKFGLTMQKKFEKDGAENEKSFEHIQYPYTYTLTKNNCDYETDFYKDGTRVGRSDITEETLYTGILEKQTQGQEQYTCKNCGHTNFLSNFASGCPMCGTTYEMPQIYPCITGYYTRPTVISKKLYKGMMKGGFWYFGLLGAFFGLLAGLSIADEQGLAGAQAVAMVIFATVIFGGGLLLFGFVFFHLMLGPVLAAKKVTQVSKEAQDSQAAAETKARMEADLKKYDEAFSYEYFEEKVLSLLRGIVFSDDRDKLTIYDNPDPLRYMDNIVDVEYRGTLEYVGSSVVDNVLRVSAKAYVTCAYYESATGKVEFSKHVFHMILAKKVKKEDYGFTIHAVNCKKCAGSFDAIHVSTCPYCGSEYSLIEDNWVVNQITCVETTPMYTM